jgi:uncharacterized protein
MNLPPSTFTVWLHITNQCNLRCDYCYLVKDKTKMDLPVGKRAVEVSFDTARAYNFKQVKLKYAGGEPTLNFPLLVEIQSYAQVLSGQYEIPLDGVVLTNAVSCDTEMISQMRELKLRASVSLDGIGKYHDQLRGRGTFKKVKNTIKQLVSANIPISITLTISNRNLAGVPEAIDYLLENRIPFALNFFRENDCSSGFSDLRFKAEDVIPVMRKAYEVIERKLPEYSLLGSLLDRVRLDRYHQKPCGVGENYMVVNPRGEVSACHMLMNEIITDIWQEDSFGVLLQNTGSIFNCTVDEKQDCAQCQWRYRCAGGCPLLTQRVKGSVHCSSPHCEIYQALIPEVLRIEGLRMLQP